MKYEVLFLIYRAISRCCIAIALITVIYQHEEKKVIWKKMNDVIVFTFFLYKIQFLFAFHRHKEKMSLFIKLEIKSEETKK